MEFGSEVNPELKPLADLIESLSREIHVLSRKFDESVARFDAMNVRQDLQGGKIRAGALWTTRIDAWSDNVDRLIFERDKQILDLQQRVAKLENGRTKSPS